MVLVCGSRYLVGEHRIPIMRRLGALVPGLRLVIHGAAPGADSFAAWWAKGAGVPVRAFPADWKTHGPRAGPERNQQMLDEGEPDLVLAFHTDPKLGRGTADMVRRARAAGVPVEIHIVGES